MTLHRLDWLSMLVFGHMMDGKFELKYRGCSFKGNCVASVGK